MTLTEFLLARITEDEAVAAGWPERGQWGSHPEGGMWMDTTGRPIHGPRVRVLAECEAKRRIIDEFSTVWQERRPTARRGIYEYVQRYGVRSDPLSEDVLRFMALPYADHPDYLQEWKS